MSRPPASDEWSDERLDAAFEARAAVAPRTPPELSTAVVARVTDRTGRVGRSLRWSWVGAAAAIVLVGVLAGSAVIGPRPATPSVPIAGASGHPSVAASGAPSGPTSAEVLAALGDPIDVSAALAVRSSDHPDREIAVRGFLSPGGTTTCPAIEVGEPVFLACSYGAPWLMERAETRAKPEPGSLGLNPPVGPAFQVIVFLDVPAAAEAGAPGDAPVDAVLIGHFDDRRVALCVAQRQDFCARTFVVDRIAELGGQALDVQTHRVDSAAATDLEADVDALVRGVAPGAVIQSRALIPISTLLELEPILIHDLVIPNVANQETRVWLVTVTDLRSGVPVARTFALIDGSSWFAEITADGARLLDRAAIAPAISATPVLPPAPEDAFRDAPREVAGIRVTTIGVAMQERQAVMGNLGRDEFAIEAWYIAPNPAATCAPALPALHAPLPLCDEARHWLLDDPQQYGVEPGQLRRDPSEDLWPPVLNPIVPIDVPLDILGAWDGGVPRPLAVIVLGHFDDVRVDTYAGNVYFVIDALVWTPRQGPDGSTPIVRLAQDATEDPSAVLARVARLYPTPAALTWVTVVDAKDFASLDRRAVSMPEFSTGAPVWIVRSLVPSEMDGRQRMAVQWAWTADHGTRVWWTPAPDSQPDLATTIDLPNLGSHTSLLRLYDYAAQITKASATAGSYAWHEIGPIPDLIDVARGGNDHQVAIRWKGVSCDTEWRLEINAYQGQTVIQPRRIGASDCESGLVTRTVLIDFDHPVDIDTFRTGDPCCG